MSHSYGYSALNSLCVSLVGSWKPYPSYPCLKQHRPGVKHTNTDVLSQISEELEKCNCYEAWKEVSYLPFGDCPYYTKPHNQWGAFELEVDYVVPLAARQLEVSSEVFSMAEDHSGTSYTHQYKSQV